ncbi:MAG TPA: hypothetical protein VGF45_12010 [Polyangia bacterium]
MPDGKCPEVLLGGLTLADWASVVAILTMLGAIGSWLWRRIPPFSSRIESGQYNDSYEYLHSWEERYAYARVASWSRCLSLEFWTSTIWEKLHLRLIKIWWWLRRMRPEVDKPRMRYRHERAQRRVKKPKWRPNIKPVRAAVGDVKNMRLPVPAQADLREGDVVYIQFRDAIYDDPKHKFPLFEVLEGGTLRRIDNGEVSHIDEEEWERKRYFWYSQIPRPLPPLPPPAAP